MNPIDDYFIGRLADVIEQDQERWDTKYMPDIDRNTGRGYTPTIDDFVNGYEEDEYD